MKGIRFHPEARAELRAAVQFYERASDGLGRELTLEMRAVLERVADLPESGSPEGEDVRRVVLGRFPFAIIYQIQEEHINIVAVMHQRQRPGYWRHRA